MHTRKTVLSAAVAAVLITGTALAQEQEAAKKPMLGEIVVTARKAAEPLKDVPLAVTALDAAAIQDAGIRNLDDVANQTPGLTFFSAFGEDLPTPVIRGVAQTQIFGENNVAVFVDGAYVSGRTGINFSELDVERIEVVKGPQSAMYGRGSFAGAINFITARPTDDFQGQAALTVGENNTRRAKLLFSGPITETLKGRIAMGYDMWDGSYINQNPGGGPKIGGYDRKTVDGSLLFEPNDALSILAKAYYSHDTNFAPATGTVLANCEARPSDGRLQNFCGTLQPVGSRDLAVVQTAYGQARRIARGNLNIDYYLDAGKITAITGYSNVEAKARYDASRGGGDYSIPFLYETTAGPNVNSVFWTGLVQDDPTDSTKEFSQELRFTSNAENRVRYGFGAYYWTAETKGRPNRPFSTHPAPSDLAYFRPVVRVPVPFPPFSLVVFSGNDVFGPWFGATQPITVETDTDDSYSAFGHVEADFADKLTGRLELRYADEKRKVVATDGNHMSGSWSFPTGRASLTWKPQDTATYYLAVARGVKSGGFSYDSNSQTFYKYDPEKLWSYEAGAKVEMFDRRAFLDLSLFYMSWKDIIIPQVDDSVNPPVAYDTNAGTATSKGIEVQFTAALTDHLTLGLGGTVNDAKYDKAYIYSFATFPSFAPDGNVSGNQLLRQSKYQANGNLSYRAAVNADYQLFWRVDAHYQSKQYIGADNEGIIPSRTVANARIGFESERFRLELWGENIFNNDNPVAAFRDVVFSNSPDGVKYDFFPWRMSVTYPNLSRFGVTATVKF